MPTDDLTEIIDRFDGHWRDGLSPQLERFLPNDDGRSAQARRRLLLELILVDMEYRCRAGPSSPPAIEQYVARFPELGSLEELPDEIVLEEYRLRCRWGEPPSMREIADRFPQRAKAILAKLNQIEREVIAEGDAFRSTTAGRTRDSSTFAKQSQQEVPWSKMLHLLGGTRFEIIRQLGSGGDGGGV